jgi:hypothetical protein
MAETKNRFGPWIAFPKDCPIFGDACVRIKRKGQILRLGKLGMQGKSLQIIPGAMGAAMAMR